MRSLKGSTTRVAIKVLWFRRLTYLSRALA